MSLSEEEFAQIAKWDAEFREREARCGITIEETLKSLLLALSLFCLGGCIHGDTGSRTVVGNHFALPKLATADGNAEIEIYESTEGAVVTTRKDCAVKITYANAYTNSVFGLWQKQGTMSLEVAIEPTETQGDPKE